MDGPVRPVLTCPNRIYEEASRLDQTVRSSSHLVHCMVSEFVVDLDILAHIVRVDSSGVDSVRPSYASEQGWLARVRRRLPFLELIT